MTANPAPHPAELPPSEPAPEPVQWPERAFSLQGVRCRVASMLALPDAAAAAINPVALYAQYTDPPDQRLTARLAIRDGDGKAREVVYKENRLPLYSASARAHALVSRHCGGSVPHVIAWEEDGGTSRLLYQPFEGRSVGDSGDPVLLGDTARTVARIQNAVAPAVEAGGTETAGIPRVEAEDIPSLFESVFAHIQAHAGVWERDEGGKLSEALGAPAAEVLDLLNAARGRVVRCAEEVAALKLPTTIDHGDLHGGNAFVQPDGSVLIHDWETAALGCPLFSLDKLLVAASNVDQGTGSRGPWGYSPGTPTQALVRDAYLDELGRPDISGRAFAAALCLACVKEMHAEITWAKLVGWPDGNPQWTAQLIRRMGHHLRGDGREGRETKW